MKKIIIVPFLLATVTFASCLKDGDTFLDKAKNTKGKNSIYLLLKGIETYKKGCKKGNLQCCKAFAENFRTYIFLNQQNKNYNFKEDINLMKQSCDNNIGQSCYVLGTLYSLGLEINNYKIKKDSKKAFDYYRKACKNKVLDSCSIYYAIQKNYKKLNELCSRKKHIRSCINLASFYENGIGVKKDEKKVISYLKKACNYGNGASCYEAAIRLIPIKKIKEVKNQNDIKKILSGEFTKLLKKSCASNYKKACNLIKKLQIN